jgi:hypothetical protein
MNAKNYLPRTLLNLRLISVVLVVITDIQAEAGI